jgi:hypothetical protein
LQGDNGVGHQRSAAPLYDAILRKTEKTRARPQFPD